MRDLIITSKQLKKEIYILSACFAAAFLTNIVSIILFKTPWYEVFTQLGYVIFIALFFYLLVILVRVIVYMIRKLIKQIAHGN